MNKRQQLYNDINNKIMAKLQEGVLPWRKSWKNGLPRNFISGNVYQGINYLNLCFEDYPSEYYITFLQCKSKDGFVNKGAKSKSIIYWKISEIDDGGNITRVPLLRMSNIFNLSDTSLFDDSELIKTTNVSCQEILDGIENMPVIKHNFNRCYYSPSEDYISIPRVDDFESEAEFLVHYFMRFCTPHNTQAD